METHITLKNIEFKCDTFFQVKQDPNVRLSNFFFENLNIETKNAAIDKSLVKGFSIKKVCINNKRIE